MATGWSVDQADGDSRSKPASLAQLARLHAPRRPPLARSRPRGATWAGRGWSPPLLLQGCHTKVAWVVVVWHRANPDRFGAGAMLSTTAQAVLVSDGKSSPAQKAPTHASTTSMIGRSAA